MDPGGVHWILSSLDYGQFFRRSPLDLPSSGLLSIFNSILVKFAGLRQNPFARL